MVTMSSTHSFQMYQRAFLRSSLILELGCIALLYPGRLQILGRTILVTSGCAMKRGAISTSAHTIDPLMTRRQRQIFCNGSPMLQVRMRISLGFRLHQRLLSSNLSVQMSALSEARHDLLARSPLVLALATANGLEDITALDPRIIILVIVTQQSVFFRSDFVPLQPLQ